MLGPKWATISPVKMIELEAFKPCDSIQAESSLDCSVNFGNAEAVDSTFETSWKQQHCNLRLFNGKNDNIDPHIDHMSVLPIS